MQSHNTLAEKMHYLKQQCDLEKEAMREKFAAFEREQALLRENYLQVMQKLEGYDIMKQEWDEQKFWLTRFEGASPVLAAYEVMKIYMYDVSKEARTLLTKENQDMCDWPMLRKIAKHFSRTLKNQFGSYYILLLGGLPDAETKALCQATERELSQEQEALVAVERNICLEKVHSTMPCVDRDIILEWFQKYVQLTDMRDDAGHPVMRSSVADRKLILDKLSALLMEDKLPTYLREPPFIDVLLISIQYVSKLPARTG